MLPMVQIMDDLRTASGSTSIDRLEIHSSLFLIELSLKLLIVFLSVVVS